ncbi:MAG: F0F1 ATP synthase subunit B [bacterium]|nr:F0F1 ATP synthase subunit B [bacterium]
MTTNETINTTEPAQELQTMSTAQTETAEHSGVLGTFGIEGGRLAGQAMNFIIVAVVLWIFVFKPVIAKLDERTKIVENGLHDAEEAQKRLQNAEKEEGSRLAEADRAVLATIDEAKKKADEIKHAKVEETKKEIEKIVQDARVTIQSERAQAYDALRKEIAVLVTSATEKVVRGLDPETKKKLITEAIADLEEKNV